METSGLTTVQASETMIIIEPSYIGMAILALCIIFLGLFLRSKPHNGFSLLYKSAVEGIYNFIEEIVGTNEKRRVISSLVSIFFVVLFANLLGLLGDIMNFVVVDTEGKAALEQVFQSPTSNRNGTTALAIIIVVFSLVMQGAHLGPLRFFKEYLPITGKGFITGPSKSDGSLKYYLSSIISKIFDIIISLFIGLLDIVGVFAKIISLSFRLFGNMLSGTILLGLLTAASIGLSDSIAGINFPFLIPIILWIQSLLVALVQAFVITLLGAIFIKVAKT